MLGPSYQRAIQWIAEQRIEAALERGDFDRLPGLGHPLDWDALEYDPNWWIRAKLQREAQKRSPVGIELPQ